MVMRIEEFALGLSDYRGAGSCFKICRFSSSDFFSMSG